MRLAAHRGLPVYFLHLANQWVPLKSGRAFPRKGAPLDFVGVVAGIPVALECKEVGSGSRFPLNTARLPEKEVEALRSFENAGGKAFLVIAFWELHLIALVPFADVKKAWEDYKLKAGPASIDCRMGRSIPEDHVMGIGELIWRSLKDDQSI
ncbi:MAG: Holliday junction resolvase RecU [Candidatus Methanomethyliaceae archaeon]